MTRTLFRILLCSLLGGTTALSGCALIRNDSPPMRSYSQGRLRWLTISISPARAGHRRSGGGSLMTHS